MSDSLDSLIEYIVGNYPFTSEKFPRLEGLSEEQKMLFVAHHLVLHSTKTSGKLAAVLEAHDHGEALRIDDLKADVIKQIVTMLRFSRVLEMPTAEIIARIEDMYRSHG